MGDGSPEAVARGARRLAIIAMVMAVILPIAGFFLGISAKKQVRKLRANNEDDQEYLDTTLTLGNCAIWLSIIVIIGLLAFNMINAMDTESLYTY